MRKKVIRRRELSALGFLCLLFLGTGAFNPAFFTPGTIYLMLDSSVIFTVAAMGMAFVILTGEIDLSAGATLGMAAAISARLLQAGQPIWVAILSAVGAGLIIGFVNGFGVTRLRIPSVIMTLGMQGMARSLIHIYLKGEWVETVRPSWKTMSQARAGGTLTYLYIAVIGCLLLLQILLSYTRAGRYFPAVGDNKQGASLLGVPVTKTRLSAFVISGGMAAIAGTLYISRFGAATPLTGSGYSMAVIVACVIGGVQDEGGAGSLVGAAIGAVIMSSIPRMLGFVGLSASYSNVITGMLLMFIVVSDAVIRNKSSRADRKQRLNA